MSASPSLYQQDYSVNLIGKRRKKSKRQITWTFGVGDAQQHTVIFTWSFKSGKILIYYDDYEEFFEKTKGYDVVDHAWESKDGFRLRVLACRVTPTGHDKSSFLQYELIINNQEFSKLPTKDGRANDEGGGSIVDIVYPNGLPDQKHTSVVHAPTESEALVPAAPAESQALVPAPDTSTNVDLLQ